ncbi:asparagine synthase C-terminal domain-containing protein [Halorubrum vacuolatum]|uniref:Asparagine synthase (Glutamine-hydrolysing) n=1 Tax=Halorubrum vacuolatum TaxID=63740 RepID=A0A238UU52_HALVU|nr:asparagine synthase-related protein [Halorubrum vacuolatum]SNR25730.1 asparagine synthase (glutamine-hydrolysing) [Halorubrum vacuolatum]
MSPSDGGETDDRLFGADADHVRRAIAERDPLPGTQGFAGLVTDAPVRGGPEPALVRDVLGRQPLFIDRERTDGTETEGLPRWSVDPTDLADPEPLPPGSLYTQEGPERWWSLPTPEPATPAAAQEAVNEALGAVRSDLRSTEADDVAVAFSGGVDSGVVAAGLPDAPCYVVGFEGCHDIAAAREAADAMDRDLRVVEITHDDLRWAIPAVATATGRRNAMDLNIAVPLFLVAEAAATDGFDRLAVGQGADELFGGYSKVVEPASDHRVAADTVRGARDETVATLPAQLERDVVTLRAAGVEPVAPLLDDRLIAAALELPGELLATAEERKIALRRAAIEDVPPSVATADKKAVQYGTYVSREIDRLARQNGFKRRMDDHVGQYVASLAASERGRSPSLTDE